MEFDTGLIGCRALKLYIAITEHCWLALWHWCIEFSPAILSHWKCKTFRAPMHIQMRGYCPYSAPFYMTIRNDIPQLSWVYIAPLKYLHGVAYTTDIYRTYNATCIYTTVTFKTFVLYIYFGRLCMGPPKSPLNDIMCAF